MKLVTTILFSALLAFNSSVSVAEDSSDKLEKEILEMDRLLFEDAFNKCDLELYKKIVSPELEFYDDRSGLNADFSKEIASFKDRCSKSHDVTRKLVRAEAFVLGNYGAVEIGEHDFYVDDRKVENARFIIIWERKADSWIMKRTVSFEHKAATDEN
tara:strand:- start:1347 stop:1817 length:471 start_codon:yes stop_codon:yes gene_type:complete